MRPNALSLALALAVPMPAAASAQPGTPTPDVAAAVAVADFDRIVVTATRTQRALEDVPNTVDVIERERMDEILVRDLKDLFRYEPGITVTEGFGRFGIGDIRIRGLGGNRVRIQVDGIPIPDAFAIGSFSDANRNFVDPDTLKRVEVVRGPTSSLYGSDALGGTVAFITKDPVDYLRDGKDAYFGFKLGYESDWNGLFGSATAAFGGDRWSGLVAVGHRQGREQENQGEVGGIGSARTQPNPQSRDGRSVLAKLAFAPSADQRFRLTVEGNEDATDTDVLTARGFSGFTFATTLRQSGEDRQTRARVSFAHEMDAIGTGVADSLDWQVYRQDSETAQRTFEERIVSPRPPPSPQFAPFPDRREREFNFDQRLYGVQASVRKAFDAGDVRHTLSYGIEVERTETRQKRDGRRIFPLSGVVTPVVPPDVFPVRDFPVSDTTQAGAYVQDEVAFADGAFRLIPALRVDYYKLEPQLDVIFAGDNPGVAVTDLSETNVSPKLGAVWRFAEQWSLFGGYSRGFRSPPYNDANIGFTNLQFGYTAIPNPDLRPETSDGFEAGVRFLGAAAYLSLAGYYNGYDDFIESLALVSAPPQTPLRVFQSRNVSQARIYGAELKAGVDFGRLSEARQGWSLRGAAAWSRGDDRTADEPLATIDPPTATLGVAFEGATWGAELAGRFVGRRDRLPPPPTGVTAFYETPGYGALDLLAHWTFAPGATIHAGVFNLADRTYSEAGNVPLADAGSATLDRFTAAGRNFALSVSVDW
jgi:hemoglobin/transferrin/lactoferrin receptor protein